MNDEYKSAFKWAEELGVTIHDPDGWRRDGKSMHDDISREDFIRRMSMSTISLRSLP